MKHLAGFLAVSLSLMLLGCTIPLASVEEDAKAKSFIPESQKASVYIFEPGLMGSLKMIAVNGHWLGGLFPGGYLHAALPPGQYIIESQAGHDHQFLLPISVEAGRQYFVLQEGFASTSSGLKDWNRLTLVPKDAGRPNVIASRMAASPASLAELTPLKAEPAAATIPLAVGVYYTPEFRAHVVKQKRDLGFFRSETYEIPLGVASQWTFDRALRNTFERVRELPDWPPPAGSADGLDLLLVLRPVSDNSARYGNRRPSLKYSVGVFASSGELQTSLTIDGFAFGNVPRNMVFGPPDRSHFYFGNSWSSAMGSAAGQLVASVAKLPAVAAKGKVIPAPEKSKTMAGPTSELVEGIAVVPLVDNPKWLHGAAKIQECLENTFEKDHPGLRLISAARVREAVFPWLEAGVTPSPELLANLLGRSPIAERLKRNGVRLVLFPLIEHVDNLGGPFFCGAGAGGAGCFGVAGGEEVTKYTVPVWDVSANTMLNAPPAGETKGVSWAIGFVIPIWHMADTLGEACAEISKQFFHAIER